MKTYYGMNHFLKELLNRLEGELNPDKQVHIQALYEKALNWEPVDRLPLTVTFPYPESIHFQPFPHREIFDDPEKMLFNELLYAFSTSILLHGTTIFPNGRLFDDLTYTIRANFGTVIIASLFGARVEQRDDNPPWVRHFETRDAFMSVFDKDPEDFSQGICPQVIERYQFYKDILDRYPKLQKCIRIVLPDLQGPLDSLELLRGSAVYEYFITDPEMTDKALRLMATAQVGFAKHLQQFTTDGPVNYAHQHATVIRGNILIRNDSAIMISPDMYSEQVAPHDEFVLKSMGGGGIHSCGKIDFNIPEIFRLPSIRCFDFGQSYLNDLEPVYTLAKEKKIPLIRIRADRDELLSGSIMKRFPTGVSLVYEAGSFEEAKNIAVGLSQRQ
jgi:hypothetical protein